MISQQMTRADLLLHRETAALLDDLLSDVQVNRDLPGWMETSTSRERTGQTHNAIERVIHYLRAMPPDARGRLMERLAAECDTDTDDGGSLADVWRAMTETDSRQDQGRELAALGHFSTPYLRAFLPRNDEQVAVCQRAGRVVRRELAARETDPRRQPRRASDTTPTRRTA